jgi:hypothetical protein
MPAMLNAKPIHLGGYKKLSDKVSFAASGPVGAPARRDLAVERTLKPNSSTNYTYGSWIGSVL